MTSKKGFTLVEIVITIALIGLLMLLVVPNVTDRLANAKKNMFYDNVINISTLASNTYINNASVDITALKEFDQTNNPLDIDLGEEYQYYAKVDSDGNVIKIEVMNHDFYYSKEGTAIKKSNINKSDIVEYGGQEMSSIDTSRYVYWTITQGGSNTQYNNLSKPSVTYNTVEELGLSQPGIYIRTKISEDTVLGHEACLIYNNKTFCLEPNYWETDGETTKNKIKNDMEMAFGTTARSCYSNMANAGCVFGLAQCSVYADEVYCSDGSRICYVNYRGIAKCI